jgi:curved DNA-binding protein CbpA
MSFLHAPGDLARTPLAAVLLEALNLKASGVLEVSQEGGTSRLWFRDGRPVGAQVTTGFRPLGLVLLQAGKIDVDALSRSLAELARTGRPQGELLVEMGVVTREDVDRALADQQAAYFAQIAALDAAPFRFDAAAPVPAWTRGSRLSPVRTIVDALERPQAGALVASALQPVAASEVRLASGYAAVADAFAWTPAEAVLVARAARPVRLEAFFAPSDVAPERARAILSALLLLGLAVGAADQPLPTGDTVVGISLDEVAVPGTPAPPPDPSRRSDPAEARARRQRLLQRAMANMGVGPFSRAPPAGGPAAPPAAAPPSVTPAPGAVAPAPRPASGSPEEALRAAFRAVAPRARERSLFARLGVAEAASREDVKAAYLSLAKQFHPDRFASAALADLREPVKDFFSAVNEAYEVLSNDRKRADYLARAGAGGGAVTKERAEAAAVDAQKGEACLRTRDFARARGFLESAIRADPRSEYHAALALAHALDPVQRDRAPAREAVARALEGQGSERAFYAAGLVARMDGEDADAERFFRRALEKNPRNADAARELKHLQARRSERRD